MSKIRPLEKETEKDYWSLIAKRTGREDFRREIETSELRAKGTHIFMVYHKGQAAGWISLQVIPKLGPWRKGVLLIDELWVSPEVRKQGLGKALLERGQGLMKELALDQMRLYVEEDNLAAMGLYGQLGFKDQGRALYMTMDN